MRLVSVYESLDAPRILYQLLQEREEWQSISHKQMPSEAEHMAFYLSRPYAEWCLVYAMSVNGTLTCLVGSVYLTKQREIGVAIFKKDMRLGYGKDAIVALMGKHPGAFLANINPANEPSKALFEGMGFKKIQETYSL